MMSVRKGLKREVQEWFLSLSLKERICVLALEDRDEVRLIQNMYVEKRRKGYQLRNVFFTGWFLGVGQDSHPQTHMPSSSTSTRGSTISNRKREILLKKLSENKAKDFLFRKDRNEGSYSVRGNTHIVDQDAESLFEGAIRFSDSKTYCDTITLSSDLVSDGKSFLDVMDRISSGKFLEDPCYAKWDEKLKRWEWLKPGWFLKESMYTLTMYVAHRLAMTLWRNYWIHKGIDPRAPGEERRFPPKLKQKLLGLRALHSKDTAQNFWDTVDLKTRDELMNRLVGIVKKVRKGGSSSKEHPTEEQCETLTRLLYRVCGYEQEDTERLKRSSLKRQAKPSPPASAASSSSQEPEPWMKKVPRKLICPDSREIFKKPLLLKDGKLHEEEVVEERVKNGELHPELQKRLIEETRIEDAVRKFLQENPEMKKYQYKLKKKLNVVDHARFIMLAQARAAGNHSVSTVSPFLESDLHATSSRKQPRIDPKEREELDNKAMLAECDQINEKTFIEYLFFTSMRRYNISFDKILRKMGLNIHATCADKMRMDLIMGEESERKLKTDKMKQMQYNEKRRKQMQSKKKKAIKTINSTSESTSNQTKSDRADASKSKTGDASGTRVDTVRVTQSPGKTIITAVCNEDSCDRARDVEEDEKNMKTKTKKKRKKKKKKSQAKQSVLSDSEGDLSRGRRQKSVPASQEKKTQDDSQVHRIKLLSRNQSSNSMPSIRTSKSVPVVGLQSQSTKVPDVENEMHPGERTSASTETKTSVPKQQLPASHEEVPSKQHNPVSKKVEMLNSKNSPKLSSVANVSQTKQDAPSVSKSKEVAVQDPAKGGLKKHSRALSSDDLKGKEEPFVEVKRKQNSKRRKQATEIKPEKISEQPKHVNFHMASSGLLFADEKRVDSKGSVVEYHRKAKIPSGFNLHKPPGKVSWTIEDFAPNTFAIMNQKFIVSIKKRGHPRTGLVMVPEHRVLRSQSDNEPSLYLDVQLSRQVASRFVRERMPKLLEHERKALLDELSNAEPALELIGRGRSESEDSSDFARPLLRRIATPPINGLVGHFSRNSEPEYAESIDGRTRGRQISTRTRCRSMEIRNRREQEAKLDDATMHAHYTPGFHDQGYASYGPDPNDNFMISPGRIARPGRFPLPSEVQLPCWIAFLLESTSKEKSGEQETKKYLNGRFRSYIAKIKEDIPKADSDKPLIHHFVTRMLQCDLGKSPIDLGEEIEHFQFLTTQLVSETTTIYDGIIARVSNVVTGIWPNSVVQKYGSYATGLALPSSDIDLVVSLDMDRNGTDGAGKEKLKNTFRSRFECLADELSKQTWIYNVKGLHGAKVPVIKFMCKGGDRHVPVDVTFSGITKTKMESTSVDVKTPTNPPEKKTVHTGVLSVGLIENYLAEIPSLKPLMIAIKQYLHEKELNNIYTGGLSSYCLILMIVSFLRHRRENQNQSDKGKLLLDFFHFFGNFNYEKVGINPAADGTKEKIFFPKPPSRVQVLTILDPLDLETDVPNRRNIGGGVWNMLKIKSSFEMARQLLQSWRPTHGTTQLSRIIQGPGKTHKVALIAQDEKSPLADPPSGMSDKQSTCTSSRGQSGNTTPESLRPAVSKQHTPPIKLESDTLETFEIEIQPHTSQSAPSSPRRRIREHLHHIPPIHSMTPSPYHPGYNNVNSFPPQHMPPLSGFPPPAMTNAAPFHYFVQQERQPGFIYADPRPSYHASYKKAGRSQEYPIMANSASGQRRHRREQGWHPKTSKQYRRASLGHKAKKKELRKKINADDTGGGRGHEKSAVQQHNSKLFDEKKGSNDSSNPGMPTERKRKSSKRQEQRASKSHSSKSLPRGRGFKVSPKPFGASEFRTKSQNGLARRKDQNAPPTKERKRKPRIPQNPPIAPSKPRWSDIIGKKTSQSVPRSVSDKSHESHSSTKSKDAASTSKPKNSAAIWQAFDKKRLNGSR